MLEQLRVMMKNKPNLNQRFILGGLAWVLFAPAAQAKNLFGSEQTATLYALVVTILGAFLAGYVLIRFSQKSGTARFKSDEKKKRLAQPQMTQQTDKKTLLPAIMYEMSKMSGSGRQKQNIAQSVTELVTHAVEEQMDTMKKDLTQHYNKIIEEQRRNEAVLQHKYQVTLADKKQTAAVLESIAEGLVVVNNKGEVIMMNAAAKGLLEVEDKDARTGHSLLDSLGEKQMVSLVQPSNKKSRGFEEDREIILSAKQESTKKVLRASNAMITDENGNTVGMVSVLSDVTKQRELDQMKADFVSKVSHELRTPIVAMQHALAILSDQVAGSLTEEQQKFVSLSQRNLERLNNLINDLLDLSKLEAKKMQIRPQATAIGPVIQQVCDSLEAWANSKAVTLTQRVAPDTPEAIFDQARIIQVITNLVGNSIKFTPKQGRITIEAKRSEAEDMLEVSVSDSGPGISKEDIPKLFGKFQQVGERSATDISGTGLGLAISKEIVDLHQGQIYVDPNCTQGTRFVFTLPLAPLPSSTEPAKKVEA